MKIECIYSLKETIQKMKRETTGKEKIFINRVSDKEFISRKHNSLCDSLIR